MKHWNPMKHRPFRVLLGAALLSCIPLAAPAGTPAFTAVALQKHDAGTFYVDTELSGYGDLRMLVDTGSSYLVISEKILAQLKETESAQYSRELHGVMADGSSRIIPVYRLSGLRLGQDCWVHDVEAAVFPGHTRAILGMNVLARLAPFTFSAEPAELGLQCQLPEPVKAQPAQFTAVESSADNTSAATTTGVTH